MKRLAACAALLCTALSLSAQNNKAPAPPLSPTGPVAPDDFVVLVNGACKTKPEEFAVRDCIRGVTRQEFEQLVSIVSPNATPQAKQKLAESLGQIIILSNEAKKRELTKDPAIQQAVRFSELQALANLLLSRSLAKDAAKISDADVEAYYKGHLAEFQTAAITKILIPKGANESPEDSRKFAGDISARCVAGEDVAKLQAEADQHASQPVSKPVELQNQRRNMYPADQQGLFESKPGTCSAPVTEGTNLAVLKIGEVRSAPLPEVREAITKTIESNRLKEALGNLQGKNVISLNGKYFGTAPATPAPAQK